jgi:hypothetical protein
VPSLVRAPNRSEYSWDESDAQKTPTPGGPGRRIGPMYSRDEYPGDNVGVRCDRCHEIGASRPHESRRDNVIGNHGPDNVKPPACPACISGGEGLTRTDGDSNSPEGGALAIVPTRPRTRRMRDSTIPS